MEEQKIKQDIGLEPIFGGSEKIEASSPWHWSACSSWRGVEITRGIAGED